MIKMMAALAAACTLMACNNSSSTENQASTETKDTIQHTVASLLSDAEKAEGWQLLFDGSTTKGWHSYGGGAVGSAWKINDGTLHLDASNKENGKIVGGGNLVTDESFENFHLKLEWKIDTCGNSGIMFYVKEDTVAYKNPYETGPEMQVLDNSCHPDAKIIKHRAGDLYDLISSSKESAKPALEWNQVEIKSLNGKIDFFLNGVNVVSTTMWDEQWKKMVAASKFKQWADFGTLKQGHIVLQDHDNQVWYRNIKIRKL